MVHLDLGHQLQKLPEGDVVDDARLHLRPGEAGQRAQCTVCRNVLRRQHLIEGRPQLRVHLHDTLEQLSATTSLDCPCGGILRCQCAGLDVDDIAGAGVQVMVNVHTPGTAVSLPVCDRGIRECCTPRSTPL